VIKRSLLTLLTLVTISSLIPQPIANSSTRWEAIEVSNLSNIEQFEKRKFSFVIRISDPKVLAKLKEPGFYIAGGAILSPKDQSEFFGVRENESLNYPCFSVEPPSLGANNAYSALRGSEIRLSMYSDFKYDCWFPAGMRQGKYTLTIYQNLSLNGGWGNTDPWANFQMFVFGETDSPLSKNYVENFKGLIADGRASIQRNLPIKDVSVYRNQVHGESTELIVNQSRIQSDLKYLESEIKKHQESVQIQNNRMTMLKVLSVANTNLLNKIQVKKLSSSQKSQLQALRRESNLIKEKVQNVPINLVQQSKIPGRDPYQRFLNAVNFDLSDRPVIFYAEYPEVSTINVTNTPFLKFMVKSKAQIYRISAWISPLKDSSGLGFIGNVVFPGQEPRNNQVGGGLALIERQEIQDGYLYSTVLVSPMYTPISDIELKDARSSTHTYATVIDVAGNSSLEWNRVAGVDGLIPKPKRPDFQNNYFDELKKDYQELFVARQELLKITDFLNQPKETLEEIASLEKASLELKKKILTIGK
jgi:hypothetical protein